MADSSHCPHRCHAHARCLHVLIFYSLQLSDRIIRSESSLLRVLPEVEEHVGIPVDDLTRRYLVHRRIVVVVPGAVVLGVSRVVAAAHRPEVVANGKQFVVGAGICAEAFRRFDKGLGRG